MILIATPGERDRCSVMIVVVRWFEWDSFGFVLKGGGRGFWKAFISMSMFVLLVFGGISRELREALVQGDLYTYVRK